MTYSGPYKYSLVLQGEKERTIKQKFDHLGNLITSFSSPITKNKCPKIYILMINENIVYVGYTGQSVSNRLRSGINPKGAKGYKGYKWKVQAQIKLFVFVFNQDLKGNQHKDDESYILLAEAVEAELVYKVRNETGRWPEFQNEIHFNNESLEKAKIIANEMFGKITE
jgi:hypothetical protein